MQVKLQIFFRMVPEKLNFKIWKIAKIESNSVIFQARNSRFCIEVDLDNPLTIIRENFSNTSELRTFTPAMSTSYYLPYFYQFKLEARDFAQKYILTTHTQIHKKILHTHLCLQLSHQLLILRTCYPTFSISPSYGKQSWGAPTPLNHPPPTLLTNLYLSVLYKATTMQNF